MNNRNREPVASVPRIVLWVLTALMAPLPMLRQRSPWPCPGNSSTSRLG